MLNTFPHLLTYSFFAPTLLRIVAALAIAYVAYIHIQRRTEATHIRLPIVGHITEWMMWIGIAIETLIALALFFGYHTQIAALLAGLMSIKHYAYAKKYSRLIPLCRADYLFLLVICASLMLTGAGAMAFDLPL